MARKIIVQNRKARHDYQIDDTLEVGVVLVGTEVKSLRLGRASIAESYATEKDGELYLINAQIPEYAPASRFNHPPKRPRKLLLSKKDLARLFSLRQRQGATLVPISLYFNERGLVKLELGIAKGKKKADKRQAEKDRDWQRQKSRLLKERD
jgi:SsrA-binding protein